MLKITPGFDKSQSSSEAPMHLSQNIGDRARSEDNDRSPRSGPKLNRDRRAQTNQYESGAPAKHLWTTRGDVTTKSSRRARCELIAMNHARIPLS